MIILIADDEQPARLKIKEFLKLEEFDGQILEACNGHESIQLIEEQPVDLVFLDIQMPGMNGFDVIETIGTDNMPAVVFVTAYDKYAISAFDVQAIDYLLKPYNRERFSKALHNALAWIQTSSGNETKLNELITTINRDRAYLKRLTVNRNGRYTFIGTEQVMYLSAEDKYVRVHTNAGTYLIRDTLKRLESRLDPEDFVRIHRSYLVRIDAIRDIQNWFHGDSLANLVNGDQVPVSRRYRSRLLDNE